MEHQNLKFLDKNNNQMLMKNFLVITSHMKKEVVVVEVKHKKV